MRELKYEEIGGDGSGHPELEEIAAYLDGRLSRAERAGIRRHLSVCDECLELFTETAHVLREIGADAAGGEVIPFARPSSPSRRWLPYVAAAAVLLALAVPVYRLFWTPREVEVAELIEPFARSRAAAGAVWTGEIFRGAEDEAGLAFRANSFLVGAHLVGFQVALAVGDRQGAGSAAQRVANSLKQGYDLDAEVERFREAQHALLAEERPASTSSFARLTQETNEEIEKTFSEIHLSFGAWAQAGYIAARTGNSAWFERQVNRRFLSRLLRQDEEIDSEALTALRQIEALWERGELGRGDFDNLAAQFLAILQRYEALSRQDTLSDEE